jgi:hydroxymethylpyrimidine pyrophosphatase-like HAD family hydrolase
MDILLIAADLAQTLLRNDKTISGCNVLNLCLAKGIKLVAANARPKRTVLPCLSKAPAHAFIHHNGALVVLEDVTEIHFGI